MPLIQPQNPQQPVENQPVGRRERGTGFTNIQRLLGANVGAGQKMGSAIGQSLGAKAGQLAEDVTRAGKAFQDRYDTSTGKQEKAFEAAEGLIPSSVEGVGGIGQMSEEDVKSIGKQLAEAKTYQGPMGIEGASQLASRAKSIGGLGELAKSGTSGQGLLLQGIAGKAKPYTRGQSALDTFLLGQSKEAQKDIKQAAAHTAGAEQQAQTVASGAEQQAKEGSKALSARGTDILRKAAESGEAIQKYGKEQASAYLKDAERLQYLMANAGKIDEQTGIPIVDPTKLNAKDIDLINRAGEFGVDVAGTFVDPRERFASLSKNILAGIAGTGEIVGGGELKLSEPQTAALKNLALLQQQAAPEIGEFKTKRFSAEKEDIRQYLNDLKTEQESALKDIETEISKQVSENLDLGGRGRMFDPNRTYLSSFWALDPAKKMTYIPGSIASNLEALKTLTRIKPELLDPYITKFKQQSDAEKLTQKGITIGDYLKSLYGINSQGSGQA